MQTSTAFAVPGLHASQNTNAKVGAKPNPAALPDSEGTAVTSQDSTLPPDFQPDPLWQAMATAVAQAHDSDTPVTVDAATNPYATLVAKPDGTFTAQQFITPQRAKVSGQWKPIDTTLTASADGSIHSKVTLPQITLSGGGAGPLAVVDDGVGHALTFTWPAGQLPTPVLSGDTATYPNVYPGVDLQMVAEPAGIRDLLVIHDASAAANPALSTISLGVTGTGLDIATTSAGGVTANDTSGNTVFSGPTPEMWDSAGTTEAATSSAKASDTTTEPTSPVTDHAAMLPATVSDGTVSVHPDQALLTAASTVYPVTIDPTWTENAQDWDELYSNNETINHGQNPFFPDYDSSAIRVGNNGSITVRSLMSFSAMPLPRPGNPDAVNRNQQAIYITNAYLKLTAQSDVCPSTQVWRANRFTGTDSRWKNQDSPELWPKTGQNSDGTTWSNPVATPGGFSNCQGHVWSIAVTPQVQTVYDNHGNTYTIGLRAADETSTTNNYGSFYIQNNAGAASLSVDFGAEPFGIATGAGNNNTVAVGNHGNNTAVCGTDSAHPGFLPVTAGSIPVTAQIGDWDTRPVSYEFALNDSSLPQGSLEQQPDATPADGTISGGSGIITVPSYAGENTRPNPTGNTWSTVTGSVQAGGNNPNRLKDGHEYELWTEMSDAGTDALGQELNTALTNAINNSNSSAPHTPPCYFIAAMSAPTVTQISSTSFPAAGQHITTGYPTVGTTGTITVKATAPATPIDHFEWALNTTSTNEGHGNCGNPVPNGVACDSTPSVTNTTTGSDPATLNATANITIPASGEHWGTNYLYVSAIDKAGNVSANLRYDFFLAQAWQPVSFGNVTGDGIPDLMGTDAGGNLVTYQANLDPTPGASSKVAGSTTGAVAGNSVQAAPAAAAPNGTSWATALYTHRGAERVQPTDDLFVWDQTKDPSGNPTGHLYYYLNSVRLSVPTPAGQNPNPPANAFTQTQKTVTTRPTCTPSALNGFCAGYDKTWNSVQQILALGPVSGGCNISAPTTACKTNLITVESYPPGSPSRVWMFSPAGVGQLTNPVLLSVSQPGWNWSTTHLMAPGNVAGHPGGIGGMPDLWAVDSEGTLWQFTNHSDTGIRGAGLGNLSTKTMIGRPGQFAHYQKYLEPGVDPSGKPDLWAVTPDRQVIALTGPIGSASAAPLSPSVTSPTQIGWTSAAGISSLQGTPITGGLNGQIISDVVGGATGQKCLDDLNGTLANGSIVDIYDCNGTWPQQWTLQPDGTIRLMGSNPATPPNVCLDSNGSVQGTPVVVRTCDPSTIQGHRGNFQIWRTIPSPSTPGHYWIYSPGTGFCLDDTGGSTTNHTQFQIYRCLDNTNQRFTLPTGDGQTQRTEAENLGAPWGTSSGSTTTVQGNCCGTTWSNGAQLWMNTAAVGSSMTLNYYVANSGLYQITPTMTKAVNYGKVTLTLDNSSTPLPATYDGWQASGVSSAPFHFGTANLSAGMHSFTFKIVGTNPSSTGSRYEAGVDTLTLTPTTDAGPTPGLTMDDSAFTNLPVTADASASLPGTAAITSYAFDFGDGTVTAPQTAPTVQHTYTTAGTYSVKVTATDANGASASTTTTITITSGPLHQWKFDDGSGATAADTGTPGGSAATLSGGATLAPSGFATFDGISGQAATAGPVLKTAQSYTVSAWVKINDTSTFHHVMTEDGANGSGFYLLYDKTQEAWAFYTINADTTSPTSWPGAVSCIPAVVGAWTQLTGVYDANTNTFSLYVNGQLAGTGAGAAQPWNASGPLRIGAGKVGGDVSSFFHGDIADAQAYQQALTADQASWLYQNSGFIAPAVANSDFETGSLAGWSKSYNAGVTTTNPHGGTYAGQLNATTGNNGSIEQVVTGLKPNTSYTLSGWVRTDGGATFLGAKQYDSTGNISDANTTATDWTQLADQFTTGATATSVDIYCYRSTAGTSACDDFTLVATPVPVAATVTNADFETGSLAGWNSSYNSGVTTTNPHGGTYAGQIDAPANGNGSIEQVVTGLQPNTSYTLSGWVRTDGGATFLGAKQYDSTGNITDANTTATDWTQLTDQFTTGATATSVDIYCYRSTAGTSACDDINLVATPAPVAATVTNADFETGSLAGWNSSYNSGVTTTNPHGGTYAGQINAPANGNGSIEQVVTGLQPNTSYTLTGWVRTDGGTTFLGTKQYTDDGDNTDATTTSTTWTQLTDQFTTGATNTSVDIYCYRSTAGTSDCDDFTLTKG